jgi:hypothetical protein
MRCVACNVALDDLESTRKSGVTGEYVDLCNTCFWSIPDSNNLFDSYDNTVDGNLESFDDEESEFLNRDIESQDNDN